MALAERAGPLDRLIPTFARIGGRLSGLLKPSMTKKVLQTHAIPKVDLQHGAQKVACCSNIRTGHGLEFEIKVLLKRSAVRQVA